jgi:hypothetical protein
MVAKRSTKVGTKRASTARAAGDDELLAVAAEQDKELSRLMAAIDATLDEIERMHSRNRALFG